MITRLSQISEGEAFHIVVVGAGGAGMSAALFGAINGAKVLLVEKSEYVGGTTAFSAGTTWVPNSHHARSVGAHDDSLEKDAHYLDTQRPRPGATAVRRSPAW